MADAKKAIEQFRAGGTSNVAALTADQIRAEIAVMEKALHAAEEAEAMAAQSGNAKRATALLTAMRTAQKEIESLFPGSFSGDKWEAITPQAWPRDTSYKRLGGLSETEVHEARERGKRAVAGL